MSHRRFLSALLRAALLVPGAANAARDAPAIRPGETISGSWSTGERANAYYLTLDRPHRLIIRVDKQWDVVWDPKVWLWDSVGREIGVDDDGGGYPNAKLEVGLEPGVYVIGVGGKDWGGGRYVLSVQSVWAGPVPQQRQSVRESAPRVEYRDVFLRVRIPGLTLSTHPVAARSYYSRFISASWDSSLCNGYLWQINQDSAHTLQLPPVGEDWWTMEPRLSWVVPEGGTWWLHLAVVDIDGNVGGVFHRRIRILDEPPEVTCTTHPDPSLTYPFPNVSLTWREPGIDTVYALIDQSPRTIPTRQNAQAYTSSPIRFLNQPNGTHYVHIRGSDPVGTLGPVAHLQINIGRESTPAPPGTERVATTEIIGPAVETTIASEAGSGNLPPLAVLNFAAQGVDTNAAVLLSSRLRDALVRTGAANVYERDRVEMILREQGFQKSGCTTTECAVEIGQLVNVQYIVVGEVGRLGAAYLMSSRLLDVETGRVVRTASSPGASSPDALLRYLPSMAWTLMSR